MCALFLTIAVIYIPVLSELFAFEHISVAEFAVALVMSVSPSFQSWKLKNGYTELYSESTDKPEFKKKRPMQKVFINHSAAL